MSRRRVDGLSVKPGPTQSGGAAGPVRVGGVILPPVNYLLVGLLLLFVLAVGFFLIRKRSSFIRFLTPMLMRPMR